MNRVQTCGLLAGVGLMLFVAGSDAGPVKRPSATKPRTPPAPTPAWLAPTPQPPQQATHYSTQYLSASSVPITARGAVEEVDTRPVVWVLDGAWDYRGCSTALTQANTMAGNTMELVTFVWTHGYRRLLMDQTDMAHARTQGVRLAEKILERRRLEPDRRMVIIGHSAGCAVALAAGDVLPPDSIDRVILLAPSVSTAYDLRPTLRAAREGVDVYCSKKDWVALGFVTRVVGTTDKFGAPAAGRHGFELQCPSVGDDVLAARLRQHFWTPEMASAGHTGGHYGVYAPTFLHAYLFPQIGARVQ